MELSLGLRANEVTETFIKTDVVRIEESLVTLHVAGTDYKIQFQGTAFPDDDSTWGCIQEFDHGDEPNQPALIYLSGGMHYRFRRMVGGAAVRIAIVA